MSRSHFRKSWGAEKLSDDRWRFRLWAPGLSTMTLALGDSNVAMDRRGDGWFEVEAEAPAGTAYAFQPPEGPRVPDPAARAQVGDVHGPSLLVDPQAYEWQSTWAGRPWEETVLYELHIGTFSQSGDFEGVCDHLDHLAAIGVTAIELCPVAQFSGERGWGYDGVLHYAPHPAYGSPEAMKRLVDAAHARGLMVFLDVVYNHFGPDGNYLHVYAPEFFQADRQTPWGAAIAFDRQPVRQFFIENALYWLEEYRLDGLRLDAVDQIVDPSPEHVLVSLAKAVRAHDFGRLVHLTTEDDRNIVSLHGRDNAGRAELYSGEWNDDFHHVAHVLATGENDGYYLDYSDDPVGDFATALTEGYVQQGRPSPFRDGARRGEPSASLPPTAFVNFLQNHDQTGNRAFGQRLTELAPAEAVETLLAALLLSPQIPLLFMGEEWGETRPFQFFTDFAGDLADAVREGRRREFARWRAFAEPAMRELIPDPNAPATFERSKLDWQQVQSPAGEARMALVKRLLAIRAAEIVPRLAGTAAMERRSTRHGDRGLAVTWVLADGTSLNLLVNLGGEPFEVGIEGSPLFQLNDTATSRWAVLATLAEI